MTAAATFTQLRRIGRGFVDILLPPRCLACGETVEEPDALCGKCWAGLPFSHRHGASAAACRFRIRWATTQCAVTAPASSEPGTGLVRCSVTIRAAAASFSG